MTGFALGPQMTKYTPGLTFQWQDKDLCSIACNNLYAAKVLTISTESELPQDLTQAQQTYTLITQECTDLFATHGLKHLLQLDTELLNVVEDDAGL